MLTYFRNLDTYIMMITQALFTHSDKFVGV